ncbi:MAG: putative transport system permease protein [Solirubrobacteraceae bacterium]|jgi:putative ABC transport system permease protein|nr:putative transport system permease protein [Solirubrobacteraceae bacterium]
MLGMIRVNLTQRPARTLLTSIGIAVGVATIVALLALTQGLKNSAAGLIHLGQADFGIFQKAASDPTQSQLPLTMVKRLEAQPGVADASPLQLVTEAVKSEPSAIVFGVEPGGFVERRMVLTAGRKARDGEATIGDTLAEQDHLKLGDSVKLKGRRFRVVGIYHSGVTFEDQGAIVTLRTAQQFTGEPETATTMAIVLDRRSRLQTVKHRIERVFPGTLAITDPGEAARADTNGLLISKAVVVIAMLALVIGGIAVTNTMIMAVLERQSEFGLLAAVGWSPRQVALLVFGEGVGVSLIGAGLGLGLGVGASELAVRALSASAFVTPDINAWGLGRGLIVGIAIGVLGGLYPAWRVTRLDPAQVLARG